MSQYQPLKQLIEEYSGLEFNGIAEQRLHKEVSNISQALGLSLSEYYAQVSRNPAGLSELVNQLTVNETYFYREPDQIRLFVRTLLPRLQALAGQRRLKILSVGCSSGEEPYSLAMAIQEQWGKSMLEQVQIEAGDLDETVLAKARAAVYSPFSFRALDEQLRDKYFQATNAGYQLNTELRQAVRFFAFNLKAPQYPAQRQDYDAIFFRNVSIYFNLSTREQIQRKLQQLLQRNGVLLLGSSETLGNDFGILPILEEQGQYYFAQGDELIAQAESQLTVDTLTRPLALRPAAEQEQPFTVAPALGPRPSDSAELTAPAPAKPPQHCSSAELEQIKVMLVDSSANPRALTRLEALLQAEPNNLTALLMQAWVVLNQKKFAQAQRQLNQVLAQTPWCVDGLLALGLCHKWQAELEPALQSFKKACYSNPESWLAHYHLADTLKQLDELAAAQQAYQSVRRILSNDLAAPSGSVWLPLAVPVKDVLFLTERHLLSIKRQVNQSVGGA